MLPSGTAAGGSFLKLKQRDPMNLRASLIAFLVCSAIVLGLSSPQVADAGTSVSGSSPFLVTYDGTSYHADSQSTSSSYTGTLKVVVESAVGELETGGGGTVEFAAGTFDLGSESFKLTPIHNITFQGQGIDVTVIQNFTTAAADLEPFSFFGAFGVTVRDMTVSAGGPARSTSDALDFDNGSDSLVERVKITASRGRGIVFDGKDTGFAANGNVVRDCTIDGVFSDGIELLGASRNVVEGCSITNVGGHGISATKSSASAPQPNKQSSDNIIRNNIVANAGQDGIRVNASDRNRIDGNQVTNSGTAVTGDGIRILTENGISCDDNVVQGNLATDTQATKTQRYGLNIADPLCTRTVVGDGNDFSGNDLAPINDLGSATQYGTDTVPPAAPSGLTATAVYKTQIELGWTASPDIVGVYEIWRDGALLEMVGAQTTYADTTVAAGSTHSYQVRARDASGNLSAFSNTAWAATPMVAVLFHDGFETGDLSKWTSAAGLVVQQTEVFDGSFAARASGTNTAAFATKQLTSTESNLYTQLHFNVSSQSTSANLLRLRTEANDAILTVFVTNTDRIAYRNEVANTTTISTVSAARGAWHALQAHVSIDGAASQTEVWLDGTMIAALSQTQSLGTDPIGRLELGDNSSNHSYDVALDEVDYDRELIADPDAAPTVPQNLQATNVTASAVDLAWDASSDDVGVTSYRVWRDGVVVATIGATTSYTDRGVAPSSHYDYNVQALDAAGNPSGLSNTAPVDTPGGPTIACWPFVGPAPVSVKRCSARAAPPSDSRVLAFASSRAGGFDIWSSKLDGSGLMRVTNSARTSELEPTWSPNGVRLAFTLYDPSSKTSDIGIVDPSLGVTVLKDPADAENAVAESSPAWSPRGDILAYSASAPDPPYYPRLWRMRADGSGRQQLVEFSPLPGECDDCYADNPSWAPDGRRIAYEANNGIQIIMAGGRRARSPRTRYVLGDPAWSPDGRRLVATAFVSAKRRALFVLNLEGSRIRRLTFGVASDSDPAWSPDGKLIAFTRLYGARSHVYVIQPDGRGLHQVTRGPGNQSSPAWKPFAAS
jgi:parallel beta-helix repeat protein